MSEIPELVQSYLYEMLIDADAQLKLLGEAQQKAQELLTEVCTYTEEIKKEREKVLAYMRKNNIPIEQRTKPDAWPYKKAEKRIDELIRRADHVERLNKLAGTK